MNLNGGINMYKKLLLIMFSTTSLLQAETSLSELKERIKDASFGEKISACLDCALQEYEKNIKTPTGDVNPNYQVLYEAVRNKDISKVKQLINGGIDPNLCDKDGKTVLFHISEYEIYDAYDDAIVQFLLAAGANPNRGSKFGWTPLHLAAGNHHNKLITRLLNAGANPNIQNCIGSTPLHSIFDLNAFGKNKNHYNEEGMMFLFKAGANPNIKDEMGKTVLHCAIKFEASRSAISFLLEYGVDLNKQDDLDSSTALHYAVEKNNIELVKLLLENGADPNLKNEDDCTPVIIAAQEGYDKIVSLLIRFNADLNIVDATGSTALHYAAARGSIGNKVLPLLLQEGLNPNVQNNNGWAPLHYAISFEDDTVEGVTLLLQAGANLTIKTACGDTPLSLAIRGCFNNKIDLLIKAGIDINEQDNQNRTPLHWAVAYAIKNSSANHAKIVCILLEIGADPTIEDEEGYSPLHLALAAQRADLVTLLNSYKK